MISPIKERPILFSHSMVQAILAGNKTQTRRLVHPQPPEWVQAWNGSKGLEHFFFEFAGDVEDGRHWPSYEQGLKCRYGQPGDLLYVKETWGVVSYEMDSAGDLHDWKPDRFAKEIHEMPFGSGYYSGHVIYRADGEFEFTDLDIGEANSQWKPSIHMPRIASRIQLEITGIRIERLQDCSDADAIEEGVDRTNTSITGYAKARYEKLWESINGPGSWAANPWVWVIEFKVIDAKGGA